MTRETMRKKIKNILAKYTQPKVKYDGMTLHEVTEIIMKVIDDNAINHISDFLDERTIFGLNGREEELANKEVKKEKDQNEPF